MKLISLGPRFAAELRGVDLIEVATSDDAYRAVREAFEEHSVILFRNQEIGDDVQIAFSRAFGPLERTKVGSLCAGSVDHLDATRADAMNLYNRTFRASPSKVGHIWGQWIAVCDEREGDRRISSVGPDRVHRYRAPKWWCAPSASPASPATDDRDA
jgi:hypothetical protein